MESIWFYKYFLRWYEDYDNTEHSECGITAGKNTMEAIQRLESLYGPDFYDLEISYLGDAEQGLYGENLDEFLKWREEHERKKVED